MQTSNENIRLLKPFLRGLPIIAAAIVLALMATRKYLLYAVPLYESTAKIKLADPKDGSPGANLYKDFDVFASVSKIGSEVEMIKSKVIIHKTLDSLDFDVTVYRVGQIRKVELYRQAPFKVMYSLQGGQYFGKTFSLGIGTDGGLLLKVPGETAPRRAGFGQTVQLPNGQLTIVKNDSLLALRPHLDLAGEYEFVVHSRQQLADLVLANLDIAMVDKEIAILRLNYKSPVPEKAAALVNRLAQTYVEDYIENKCKAANTTVEFLNNQLKDVGNRLSASENAIESYRNSKNIINIRQETETDLRKIADMKVQQTNVKMNLEAIENLEKYMVRGRDNILELAPNFEAYTDLLATELVKKMKQLQAEKKDLLVKYTPEYEEVKNIDAKLKDISVYLEEGIRNTRKSLTTKYARITNDIADAEKVFIGLPSKEKNMGILSRNFSLNEETYNFLHGKRTEAQIARAASISFHRIISPGETPSVPISPNGTLLKVLAVFLAFMGAVLLIYLIHSIKGKVNDVATIEKNANIPVAATSPLLKKATARRAHFHKLAIQLQIKNLLEPHSMVTFTAFSNQEGAAFHALHLAKELAAQHKKTLLLDVDGVLALPAAALNGQFDYMSLANNSHLFVNGDTVGAQIKDWLELYQHVVVLNEPLGKASNGLLLMKLSATNLFVLDSRRTPAKKVAAVELLQEEYRFNQLHFVLNRAGYNPNLFCQLGRMVKKWTAKKTNAYRHAEA